MTEPVSRETPPVPEAAAEVFSRSLPAAEAYAELLAGPGVVRGLIGPREASRLWERHLLNCAVIADLIPARAAVCDVGSGAGLPGLVLAIVRPDVAMTLVEPLLRRTSFLEEAVATLGLGNVTVVRARAEELHGHRDFDVVTSRAVAPLDRLGRWSLPLVRRGGCMLAIKGSSAPAEVEAARNRLRGCGGGGIEILERGAGVVSPPTVVVRVEAARDSRLGLAPAQAQGRKRQRR